MRMLLLCGQLLVALLPLLSSSAADSVGKFLTKYLQVMLLCTHANIVYTVYAAVRKILLFTGLG